MQPIKHEKHSLAKGQSIGLSLQGPAGLKLPEEQARRPSGPDSIRRWRALPPSRHQLACFPLFSHNDLGLGFSSSQAAWGSWREGLGLLKKDQSWWLTHERPCHGCTRTSRWDCPAALRVSLWLLPFGFWEGPCGKAVLKTSLRAGCLCFWCSQSVL